MVNAISILGSTGSIGKQSIEAAMHLGLSVKALTAQRKIDLLEEQARRVKPEFVAVYDEEAAKAFKIAVADTNIRVGSGIEGLIEAASMDAIDCVVTAVSGAVGLKPTLAAIDQKKRIALANKETLVCAGDIVMAKAAEKGAEIVPVDSEHSAIFQCLMGHEKSELKKILLTGSGGPFRGRPRAELEDVTPEQAVKPKASRTTGNLKRSSNGDSFSFMSLMFPKLPFFGYSEFILYQSLQLQHLRRIPASVYLARIGHPKSGFIPLGSQDNIGFVNTKLKGFVQYIFFISLFYYKSVQTCSSFSSIIKKCSLNFVKLCAFKCKLLKIKTHSRAQNCAYKCRRTQNTQNLFASAFRQ